MRKVFSFFFVILLCAVLGGCRGGSSDLSGVNQTGENLVELEYADQFSIEKHGDGDSAFSVIRIQDGLNYIVLSEGQQPPEKVGNDNIDTYTVIYKPLDSIYMAASSAMDLIYSIDSIDLVKMTATRESEWGIEEIRNKVASGEIEYVGKYSAPDYETILYNECDLAIESTMIYHNPEVKEALESLGIPVMVERSSYESHPMGRLEWIKLYGLLLDKEEIAGQFFDEMSKRFTDVISETESISDDKRPEVAFFSISANNYATVRKPGDYISKMIYMAGGKYAMSELPVPDENALSTTNIQLESFFEYMVDSDYLIYNSAIQGEIYTLNDLKDKFGEISEAKAVKAGNVWCTNKSVFQKSSGVCQMMEELYLIINNKVSDGQELEYFHKLT